MGDGLKLSKEKRHKSSSSIAGAGLEGTRSERKLDIRALIPEVVDHFALAESRCDDLQEKIDMVKVLRRKKKLNKRSMTRISEQQIAPENMPFISVRTQPKKKVPQQTTRLRRVEAPTNLMRDYVDPTTVEQHRMLGQVWGYGQNYNREDNKYRSEQKMYPKTRAQRNHADGDGMCGRGVESSNAPTEVACGQDDDIGFTHSQIYDEGTDEYENCKQMHRLKVFGGRSKKKSRESDTTKVPDVNIEEEDDVQPDCVIPEESKKDRSPMRGKEHTPQRGKDRSRGYEMPTVASQMRQADARVVCTKTKTKHLKIPFIGSSSTSPSHNIGVNIQQVLNGLKVQQPLYGIPLTIAQHLGLRHVNHQMKCYTEQSPSPSTSEINAIKVGDELMVLPSNRKMSFRRMLGLYRTVDGKVGRFLRALKRPQPLPSSTSNLEIVTPRRRRRIADEGCEAKRKLVEYAVIYREYQQLCRDTADGATPENEQRRAYLQRELADREEDIQKLAQLSSMITQEKFTMANFHDALSSTYEGQDSLKHD